MIISENVYYIPLGKRTIYSSVKTNIEINEATGVVSVNTKNGVETIDMSTSRAKASFGTVRFPIYQGEKRSAVIVKGPWIYLFHPMLQLISFVFAFTKGKQAKALADQLNMYSKISL
jgi:hypothetical protein